jgi:hypothetical protein
MNHHGHRLPMRLSRRHERWIYIAAALLLLTGLGWLVFHYFFAQPNDFGEAHHPSEPWWLRLHGAAAMGFLLALGSLLPGHITRGLHLRKNLVSGLAVLSMMCLLVLTAYGLYYAGDETVRPWISLGHWVLGLAIGVVFGLHVWLGKHRATAPRPLPHTRHHHHNRH